MAKVRVTPAKRWCFTWNNYPGNVFETLEQMAQSFELEYIFGKEVGENGTEHIQGYIESETKFRPVEKLKLDKTIHWERAKGTKLANVKYCSKDGNAIYSRGCRPPRKIKIIEDLKPWQERVVKLVTDEPDDRTIHWFWEASGGVGKSSLVKYLCVKFGALVVAGKATDMKFQISKYVEKHGEGPDIVIFDVPRSNIGYVSFTGMEEIKNGCFASNKYESNMIVCNSPHLLVFANSPPVLDMMSRDRWNVQEIPNKEEYK